MVCRWGDDDPIYFLILLFTRGFFPRTTTHTIPCFLYQLFTITLRYIVCATYTLAFISIIYWFILLCSNDKNIIIIMLLLLYIIIYYCQCFVIRSSARSTMQKWKRASNRRSLVHIAYTPALAFCFDKLLCIHHLSWHAYFCARSCVSELPSSRPRLNTIEKKVVLIG